VLCEFGVRRTLGVVLDVADREPDFDATKLKSICAVVDAEPVLAPELLAFLRELSSYYFAPIGEVLRLALPALERSQVRALEEQVELGLGTSASAGPKGRGKLPGKKLAGRTFLVARAVPGGDAPPPKGHAAEILELLRASSEISVPELSGRFKNARECVKKLAALSLVEIDEREEPRSPFFAQVVTPDVAPELTASQREAAGALAHAIGARAGGTFLLHGVTGSGKTEVYLRAIAACLDTKRGAMVLVPEIALTPQLVARFRARFGDDLAIIHSGLDERDRHGMWRRLRDGSVNVAIGARSALFAPVVDLGLVVVDEEHDGSFKQEEGARYHARDMAILRAYRAGAVCVLGSATPSLETEMLVERGRATRLSLPERAHSAAVLPAVELVDIKRIGPGPVDDPLLSLPLYRAIQRTLEKGEQTILFLNRRGFAPSVLCDACGVILKCKLCSVALTYHRARGGRLKCHYCDYDGPLYPQCPECRHGRLVLEGLGTEKLEATIAEAFPGARVARLDRDVASGGKAEGILGRMRAGEIDILVGTQMVTKGHDLPNVTLVGVVNADAALSMPDYRAAERAFQLLVQVAGRAGRSDRPGLVIVQTRDPAHPAIVSAARHDVKGFVARELRDREELGYPPFARLALLRIDAVDEHLARRTALEFAEALQGAAAVRAREVDVLGPAAAPIARLRGRYRFRVLLRAKERPALRSALLALVPMRDRIPNRVRVVIDVDPVQMM
jgi:primosomal protein N' (replication factor Y) (superfamily II helicase)